MFVCSESTKNILVVLSGFSDQIVKACAHYPIRTIVSKCLTNKKYENSESPTLFSFA